MGGDRVRRQSARWAHLPLVVAMALVVGTLATTQAARSAASGKAEALLVGDSVLNGLAQPYSVAGRVALAARHSFILDSAGCRRLITLSCSIPPSPAPSNALTVVRARAGQYDRALVIAAGYDDSSGGQFGVGAAVDTMIAEAHRQGIEQVIWLTYREAGTAGNVTRFRASNAVLRAKQAQYPELLLADWAGLSAGLPKGWFSADGIHLGAQAAGAMAGLIGDALDRLPIGPSRAGRCASGVWSGNAAPGGAASTGAAAAGGVQLLPAPVRFVDTRTMPGKLGPGRVLTVPIAGVNGVPIEATAAMISVVAVEPCADTFLTVFPCGSGVPATSVVNAVALSIVANSAVARLGEGAICVYSLEATDVVIDVSGWVAPSGLRSLPVAPLRLVDTRSGQLQALPISQHLVRAGQLLAVDVADAPGFDPSAVAATINVTAAAPAADGFLTVLPGPCAGAALPPTTSTVNIIAGRDVAASATVGLGGGQLCIYASTDTDVVVDLQALHGTAGATIAAVDPQRLVDTRSSHRIAARQTAPVGFGTVSAGVVVNLTAVNSSAAGFVTLYPCGAVVPTVSNLNVVVGGTVANRAVVLTGGSDQFCVYSSVDTDVVIDLEGLIALA